MEKDKFDKLIDERILQQFLQGHSYAEVLQRVIEAIEPEVGLAMGVKQIGAIITAVERLNAVYYGKKTE